LAKYRVHEPILEQLRIPEKRHAKNAPNYSINWTIGCEMEIVLSATGKTISNGISRLAKQMFFQRFAALTNIEKKEQYYSELKEKCDEYKVSGLSATTCMKD
jgi:hypothetical protein